MIERNILGLILTMQIEPYETGLEKKHFSSFVNRQIWVAICDSLSNGMNNDTITVSEYLNDKMKLEPPAMDTWFSFLAQISKDNIGKSSAVGHIKKIKDDWLAREIRNIGSEMANDENANVNNYIKTLMSLNTTDKKYLHSFHDAAEAGVDEIERVMKGEVLTVPTGLVDIDKIMGGLHNSDLIIVAARPAMGKAQPLTSNILLFDGTYKQMGTINIGDKLASIDGKESIVSGVFPQGKRDVYTLKTNDGRIVECDGEHLWDVESSRFKGIKTITTLDVMSLINTDRYHNRLRLVSHDGNFGELNDIGINPWLLGFLIGDGCFQETSIRFSTSEDYILKRVKNSIGKEHSFKKCGKYDYRIKGEKSVNKILGSIRELGLNNLKSIDKFIPEIVFRSNKKIRESVLSGLIESDGESGIKNLIYHTSSKILKDDVVNLVRSLGGKAFFSTKLINKYKYKDEIKFGKKSYRISIAIDGISKIIKSPKFNFERIKSCNPIISGIEKTGFSDCQCIMVSHESHLYITNDYTVTHNTAFMLNMAAANKNCPLVFSTEQSRIQAAQRLFSIYGNIPNHKIRTGDIDDEEFARISTAIMQIRECGGWIYDKSGPYMHEIESTARQVFHDHHCTAIYLDYLQRIKHENPKLPKHEQVGDIAMRLKELARELDIPVVALAQVNRKCEERTDKRPQMGDIKDSGTIEQEADIILTIYRDEVYFPDTVDRGIAEIDFKKNRHGGTGMVKTCWIAPTMRFTNLSPMQY